MNDSRRGEAGVSAASPDGLIAFAEQLADLAASEIWPRFRQRLAVDRKADQSPVTVADRAAEAAMRRAIENRFPDHGIIGEEHGSVRPEADYVWVLDPIDGTKSFISGIPLFGTLIALLHQGQPLLGIIAQPISGERWVGAAGRPTLFNGKPAGTRRCPSLAEAVLFATSPELFQDRDGESFARLRAAVGLVRYGADCYAYGVLAAGFIDLVAEAMLKPYDFAALIPVVEGAGGRLTDWSGRPLSLKSDGHVLASGDPGLHEAALERLKS